MIATEKHCSPYETHPNHSLFDGTSAKEFPILSVSPRSFHTFWMRPAKHGFSLAKCPFWFEHHRFARVAEADARAARILGCFGERILARQALAVRCETRVANSTTP
jgi:hypothetical protein